MRWAVAGTLVKDLEVSGSINIVCFLNIYEAISETEAVGKFVYEVSESNPEHHIHVRPVVMKIEG